MDNQNTQSVNARGSSLGKGLDQVQVAVCQLYKKYRLRELPGTVPLLTFADELEGRLTPEGRAALKTEVPALLELALARLVTPELARIAMCRYIEALGTSVFDNCTVCGTNLDCDGLDSWDTEGELAERWFCPACGLFFLRVYRLSEVECVCLPDALAPGEPTLPPGPDAEESMNMEVLKTHIEEAVNAEPIQRCYRDKPLEAWASAVANRLLDEGMEDMYSVHNAHRLATFLLGVPDVLVAMIGTEIIEEDYFDT
jgi:hypothetical protein